MLKKEIERIIWNTPREEMPKAIEQYVIKARIEECKRMTPKNWKEVLIAKLGIIMINRRDERIAQLKKEIIAKNT